MLSALAFLYKKVRKTAKERDFLILSLEKNTVIKTRQEYITVKNPHTSTGKPTGRCRLHHLSSVIPIFWKTVN